MSLASAFVGCCSCTVAKTDERRNSTARAVQTFGCVLGVREAQSLMLMAEAGSPADGYSFSSSEILRSSGKGPEFDRALGRMLVHLAEVTETYPGFGFTEGVFRDEALFYPRTLIPGTGTHGTVVFGTALMNETLSRYEDGDIAFMGICAHEFAHARQFEDGWLAHLRDPYPTVKYFELQADYIAGYFIAERRKLYPEFGLQGLGERFRRIGDLNVNSYGHHGTPDERVAAIEAGYAFGMRRPAGIRQALEAGAGFVVRV